MAKIYMVRHGRAAAGWGEDRDPDLSDAGQRQADAVARELARVGGAPLAILTSPLRRCRATAAPLADIWNVVPKIDPAVAEIPSPVTDLAARADWLRQLMAGDWADPATDPVFAAGLVAWRDRLIGALLRQSQDIIIFSHFIAINVAAGHALGDTRVVLFRPDNASITLFETHEGELILHQLGREAETKIN